jgi:hypothetical protein
MTADDFDDWAKQMLAGERLYFLRQRLQPHR